MQDMISKIIKMDEEARKITEQVQSNIEKSEEEVREYKKKIETEYLGRARKRIEKNRVTEQEAANRELSEIRNEHDKILKRLDSQIVENFDKWVEEIKKRVVGE